MAATVSFGVMCILCSYAIRPLFTWTHCCARHGTYKTKEWTGSSTFQSQRVAAEGKGIGPWKGKEGDMPTLMEPEFWQQRVWSSKSTSEQTLKPLEEEVDSQGFVELRNLGGRTAYSS
jgi:hypothetical protein